MKSTIRGVLFAVTVATLGAGVVGTACAQSAAAAPASSAPQQPHHRGHFRHFGGSPFLGSLLRATKQLSGQFALTSAQQTQIKSLLQAARPAHQPGTGAQGLGITVTGDPGNSNYPTAIQNAITAATNRINKESTLAAEIYNHVLTKPQQGQLETVLASIQAKEQARRAAWAAKRASSGNG
jgi:Spy/CpxP family protein refolding chaperone